jgi:hypothetical protein
MDGEKWGKLTLLTMVHVIGICPLKIKEKALAQRSRREIWVALQEVRRIVSPAPGMTPITDTVQPSK